MENQKDKRLIHIEVSPNEAWIIRRWRNKYRFGRIELLIHDGVPQGIEKIILKDYPKKGSALDKDSD